MCISEYVVSLKKREEKENKVWKISSHFAVDNFPCLRTCWVTRGNFVDFFL